MDADILADLKRLQQVYDAYGLQTFEYRCLDELHWPNGRSPLFRHATPDGFERIRPDGQLCGGLIEIKYPHYLVGERVAWTDEWTEAIRADERTPWSPGFLRPEQLSAFAEWQQTFRDYFRSAQPKGIN
jgi:hypothetical protein